jgi:hypothetical protein
MTSLLHKHYSISVDSTADTLQEHLFTPTVDVSVKDGKSLMKMGTTQTFATQSDAEVYGLEMAKGWIDKHHESSRPAFTWTKL